MRRSAARGRLRRAEPPDGPVAADASVLLITVDTLRADRVNAGVTPEIDGIAASGTRFTAARANAPLTLPSHVTIMTGALPPAHGVRENGFPFDQARDSLAHTAQAAPLSDRRVRRRVRPRRGFGLNAGFDMYDDRIPRGADRAGVARSGAAGGGGERGGDQVADRSRRSDAAVLSLGPLLRSARPVRAACRVRGASGRARVPKGRLRTPMPQLGRLVRAARERTADRALVVAIAGDHGESLGDHGEPTHGMLALRRGAARAAGPRGMAERLGGHARADRGSPGPSACRISRRRFSRWRARPCPPT